MDLQGLYKGLCKVHTRIEYQIEYRTHSVPDASLQLYGTVPYRKSKQLATRRVPYFPRLYIENMSMYFHYKNIVYFQEINISERVRGGGAKNNLLLLPLKAEIWRTFCRFAGSPLAGEIPQCGAIHASSGASGRENCRIWYLGVGGAVGGYVSGGRAAAAAGAGAGDILVSEKTN